MIELPAIYDDYNGNMRTDGKSGTLTQNSGSKAARNGQKVVMLQLPHGTNKGGIVAEDGKTPSMTTSSWQHNNMVYMDEILGGDFRHDEGFRWRESGKSGTLSTKGATENSLSGTPLTKNGATIRRLTPIECERLQTIKDNEISCIFKLCLDQAKNYVNVVEQNPKLQKLVSIAELSELNELVKSAIQNMNANHQSIKHIVQENADIQILTQTNKCINHNHQESNIIANNAVNIVMCNCQGEMEDFVVQDVFINIIEGKITHFGLEELHLKDKDSTIQKNGKNQLKLCGKEIMEFVKDVDVEMIEKKEYNSIFTILSRLNTKSLEQALIIYYLFAKNVITGFTQNTTKKRSLLLNFKMIDGYTNHVSDNQRYKALGNGWTVDVIAHIFSYIKK